MARVKPKGKPAPAEGSRYRVYFKGLFAGVILAPNQVEAEDNAARLLEVRLDTSERRVAA